jgi:hypothetical protein
VKIEVVNFDNRHTVDEPFGHIEFNDGLRIGYAPGADGPNKDGLFEPNQPHLMRGKELSPQHWLVATQYVKDVLQAPKTYVATEEPDGSLRVERTYG